MAEKKGTLIVFGYSDGSYEYAIGEHAEEVLKWLGACQLIADIHGASYSGKKLEYVPAPEYDLESVKSIAERTFPEWMDEMRRTQAGQK